MTTKVTKSGVGVIDQLSTGSVKHESSPVDNITLDASGNVGIGTSAGTTTVSSGLAINNATAGNYPGLEIQTAGVTRMYFNANNAASYISSVGTNPLVTYTNGVERMRIDSAGRVTMPYKPMFMAKPTTDYSGGSMPTGVIDMTVTYDNGSNFTAANDRFTAPVNGWYRTTWGGLQLPSTVTSLMINGTRTYNGNHFVTSPAYVTMTQTAIVQLSAGDYLNIEGWNGGGYYNNWYLWTVEHIG